MRTYAPIAIFTYNRPRHTENMLKSLLQNPEWRYSPILIFQDGLKNDAHKVAWEETRKVISQYKHDNIELVLREKNLGLAQSIITGVTNLTEKYGRVIVIEDDLVLSPTFLRYMNQSLDFYENDERVFHVSAYMFPVAKRLPKLFLYREVTCWGWGTWKRAWKHFIADSNLLLSRIDQELKRFEFDIEGTMGFYGMLEAQARGQIDSWAIRWYASVSLAKGLCLHPAVSMVNNDGFDGTGVHCSETDLFEQTAESPTFADSDFPRTMLLNREALKAMMEYRSLLFNSRTGLNKMIWRAKKIQLMFQAMPSSPVLEGIFGKRL